MIINDAQNLLTHLSVDLISTVEMLRISSVVKSKRQMKNKAHTKRKTKTHTSVCRLWFLFHWMSERNEEEMNKKRFGELFSFVTIQTCQIYK